MAKKSKPIRREFVLMNKNTPFQYQEAYKSLRTNLNFMAMGKACKKLIFTSAIPGEGKSSVALNLAVSLAETGSRVLVIDCDLRKPVIHRYLKIDNSAYKGITSALADGSLAESIINMKGLGLHVMVADAIPPNPVELLGSPRMKNLIDELDKHYEYIIFDTPPVSVVTDAAVLSQYADGVILVVRQNYATFDEVGLAKKNLDAVNANILGAVLNGFDTKSTEKKHGYYYSYNYSYENADR